MGEEAIFSPAKENFKLASALAKKMISKIPEPVKCQPAILLSLVAGMLGMSALFGILLPMLLRVPAIGSQLGVSGGDAAYPLQLNPGDFAPFTNSVSTACGVIVKRQDFNRPRAIAEQASFQLELASRPVERGN